VAVEHYLGREEERWRGELAKKERGGGDKGMRVRGDGEGGNI
jgi:hypothetical protein